MIVNVTPKNDVPTISTLQTFYIKENVVSGTFVNIKNPSGDACNSAPASSTSCEIKASDVDSDRSGFQFVQAASQNPFVVTQAATRHAIGTNLLGDDAYNIFTTVKFVSTNAVTLNYESANNIFD